MSNILLGAFQILGVFCEIPSDIKSSVISLTITYRFNFRVGYFTNGPLESEIPPRIKPNPIPEGTFWDTV